MNRFDPNFQINREFEQMGNLKSMSSVNGDIIPEVQPVLNINAQGWYGSQPAFYQLTYTGQPANSHMQFLCVAPPNTDVTNPAYRVGLAGHQVALETHTLALINTEWTWSNTNDIDNGVTWYRKMVNELEINQATKYCAQKIVTGGFVQNHGENYFDFNIGFIYVPPNTSLTAYLRLSDLATLVGNVTCKVNIVAWTRPANVNLPMLAGN